MRVLILGGTGTIGAPITRSLVASGAEVRVLARSPLSEALAEELGARPVAGDLAVPHEWISVLPEVDAVVHAAGTFNNDMPDIDRAVVGALVEHAAGLPRNHSLKVIYTGGVWLFGDTGDACVDETAQLRPPMELAWMVGSIGRLQRCLGVHAIVVHPGNVIASSELPLPNMVVEESRRHEVVRLPADPATRWPLVERNDLAELYTAALGRGRRNGHYLGVTEPGVPVADLVPYLAHALHLSAPPEILPLPYWISEYGPWARPYELSQCLEARAAMRELQWTPRWRLATAVR